jgi:hypothetical protein
MFKCTFPETCLHYYEIDNHDQIPRPVCLFYDIKINHTNTEIIENCQKHKTRQQLREEWETILKSLD